MLRNRKWIAPAASVIALLMSAATAHAAPNWSNFYISVFGGPALGTGSVTAHGVDPECPSDPEICIFDMVGTVGTGMLGGTALGTTIGPNTRAEIEFSFGRFGTTTNTTSYDPELNAFHGTTMDSLTAAFVFGNIWYDIPVGNQLTAYFGGGAGFAHATGLFSAPFTQPEDSDLSLIVDGFAPALQVGAGLTFVVAPKVTLDFGYRFKSAFGLPVSEASTFDQSLQQVTHSTSMNLGVHVFQVGVNFALN